MQLLLLVSCLEWAWRDRDDFFIGANLTIYFSRQQLKQRDFRGSDFFLVKNTTREPRNSWVVWEEDGRYPDLIIELLSDSTAQVDRVTKRELYAERFHTPEYFYFSPETSEALGFFLGTNNGQLRYFSWDRTLIPTPNEAAMQEIWKAEQEAQRAEQEKARADRLAAKLKMLGINPGAP